MLVIPSKSTTQKKSDAFPLFFNHFFHGNGIVLEKFHIHSPAAKEKKKSGNPFVDAAAIFSHQISFAPQPRKFFHHRKKGLENWLDLALLELLHQEKYTYSLAYLVSPVKIVCR